MVFKKYLELYIMQYDHDIFIPNFKNSLGEK